MSYATIIAAAESDTRKLCAIELGTTRIEHRLREMVAIVEGREQTATSAMVLHDSREALKEFDRLERLWKAGKSAAET